MIFSVVFIALSLLSAVGFIFDAPIIPLIALIITFLVCSLRKTVCMFILGFSESPWTQIFGEEPAYWVWNFVVKVVPFVMLIVLILMKERKILIPIYYALTLIPFFIYPAIRYIIKRINAYRRIRGVCSSHGYVFQANFLTLLLPIKKIKKPQITVKTGSETFDISVLGTVLTCPKYEFFNNTNGMLHVIEPSWAEMMLERNASTFKGNRETKFPVSGPKYNVSLPEVNDGHIALLLFDPDYGICVDKETGTVLNCGEYLYGRKTLDIKKLILYLSEKT